MKTKLTIVTAITSAALSLGAIAESNSDYTNTQKHNPMQQERSNYQEKKSVDIEGVDVYSYTGEKLGDVDRVVKDANAKLAVIGVSGSAKEIAVPLNNLEWRQGKIMVNMTRDEIDNRNDIDPGQFQTLEPGEYHRNEFSRFEEKTTVK